MFNNNLYLQNNKAGMCECDCGFSLINLLSHWIAVDGITHDRTSFAAVMPGIWQADIIQFPSSNRFIIQ